MEGGIDLNNIKDSCLQEALYEQIFHYGQTPLQIFSKPHPQRTPLKGKIPSPLTNNNNQDV